MGQCAPTIWAGGLDVRTESLAFYRTLLSSDERARARSYRTCRDGDRFVVRRGLLRTGLARLLGISPHDIRFGYAADAKPYLSEPREARRLRFNVSHSEGLALFACAVEREVGVDIERVRRRSDLSDVAQHCFSEHERQALNSQRRAYQVRAFYRCWTRKEAYVKAIGSGLAAPIQNFDVAFGEYHAPALARVGWDQSEISKWVMRDIQLPTDYVGALVMQR